MLSATIVYMLVGHVQQYYILYIRIYIYIAEEKKNHTTDIREEGTHFTQQQQQIKKNATRLESTEPTQSTKHVRLAQGHNSDLLP